MKVLVVGCGVVGSELVRDLASSEVVSSVVAADVNAATLSRFRRLQKVKTVRVDFLQREALAKLVRNADVVCGALPGRVGFAFLRLVVKSGRNVVDVSYTPQDPFSLNQEAIRNKCTLVPQCGVAPGFSNMCVGDASRRLERITAVRIFVGGIPQKPVPPVSYRVVFSLDDVISEYTRPVHLIENGRPRLVEPLSGRGFLMFPSGGRLEYFLSDGLGTLPHSFPSVREMREMTLRYPGHSEMMNTLRVLGYFRTRRMSVDGAEVEPRRVTLELLKSVFSVGPVEDLVAFRVDVEGISRGRRVLVRYKLLDRYDHASRVSAMARTTAYPCTSVALLLGEGKLRQTGVLPTETIAHDSGFFNFVRSRLATRGVRTTIQTRTLRD